MSTSSDASPVGLIGRIVAATRGADGPGEAQFAIRGGREVFLARSVDALPRGEVVICIDVLGPRTVLVEPWVDSAGPPLVD